MSGSGESFRFGWKQGNALERLHALCFHHPEFIPQSSREDHSRMRKHGESGLRKMAMKIRSKLSARSGALDGFPESANRVA